MGHRAALCPRAGVGQDVHVPLALWIPIILHSRCRWGGGTSSGFMPQGWRQTRCTHATPPGCRKWTVSMLRSSVSPKPRLWPPTLRYALNYCVQLTPRRLSAGCGPLRDIAVRAFEGGGHRHPRFANSSIPGKVIRDPLLLFGFSKAQAVATDPQVHHVVRLALATAVYFAWHIITASSEIFMCPVVLAGSMYDLQVEAVMLQFVTQHYSCISKRDLLDSRDDCCTASH